MHRALVVLGIALLAQARGEPPPQAGAAQLRSLGPSAHRIEVRLEQATAAGWQVVDPGRVLEAGGRVRFRVRASFDGYLYVLNRGTSGTFALLFPRTEDDNRIRAGREYPVPASAGHFQITGGPGFETLYWILSPARLSPDPDLRPVPLGPAPPAVKRPVPPSGEVELLPRCHDEIFRTRGECVDATAGPRAAEFSPRGWHVSSSRSRDLYFTRHDTSAVVSSTTPLTEPIIYEYRLAHR